MTDSEDDFEDFFTEDWTIDMLSAVLGDISDSDIVYEEDEQDTYLHNS